MAKHLTKSDYGLICDWLELGDNIQKMDGAEKKTKVGVRPVVRAKAFQELALYINSNQKKGSKLVLLEGNSMKTRWRHYWKRYRDAKKLEGSTGFGLTELDLAEGIKTVEEKLDIDCPHFARMDVLFKGRPNVKAWNEVQTCLPSELPIILPEFAPSPWIVPIHDHDVTADVEEDYQEGHRVDTEPLTESEMITLEINLERPGDTPPSDSVPIFATPISATRVVLDSIPCNSPGNVTDATCNAQARGVVRSPPSTDEEGPMENRQRGGRVGRKQSLPDFTTPVPTVGNGAMPTVGGVGSDAPEMPEEHRGAPARYLNRARTESLGLDKTYPSKKAIADNRHSINSAFACNLENVNDQKEKMNELRAQRLDFEREMENKKFLWQQELHIVTSRDQLVLEGKRLDLERELMAEVRSQKAAELERHSLDRLENNKIQMKLALIGSNKSMIEIKELLDLLG